MNRFMKKTVAAVMSVAMLASGTFALDAPMNRNSALFDAFSITASARSDKYTEDTLVLAANASAYSSGSSAQTWYSPNRRYTLTLTILGNLRLYDTAASRVVWQSNTGVATNYSTHTFRLTMQNDGKLVLSDTPRLSPKSYEIWDTKSATGAASNSISLRLSNEGELYVYHHDRRQSLWSSRSQIECTAEDNSYLRSSQCLTSPDFNYRAIMQCDGNFVVYNRKDGKDIPVWDTKSAGQGGAFLAMQQDGNLVLYNGKTVLWASHTSKKPFEAYILSLGNDGALRVIRKSTQAEVWNSKVEKFTWPVPGHSTISSGYGYRTFDNSFHTGIDISDGSIAGQPVVASKSGVLRVQNTVCSHDNGTLCSCGGGYGKWVIIEHSDGTTTRYAHLRTINTNLNGQRVSQGQQIGTVGSTGRSTGPHLHFEIRNAQGNHVNPLNYVHA